MEGPKKKKSVFRVDKETEKANRIREQYLQNGLAYRQTRSLDFLSLYWNEVLEDKEKYTFEYTMEFFRPTNRFPPALLADLSYFLSRNNGIWKSWFYKDFFVLRNDLMPKEFKDAHVPDWIHLMVVNLTQEHAHQDDALFVNVPWRRFYMWCRALRRSAAKYAIGMWLADRDITYLPEEIPKRKKERVYRETRDKVFASVTTLRKSDRAFTYLRPDGKTKQEVLTYFPFTMEHISPTNVIESDHSISSSNSVVMLLWITYKYFSGIEYGRLFPPNDDPPFLYKVKPPAEKGYTYNFSAQHVACFMYWYVITMLDLGKFDMYIPNTNLKYVPSILRRGKNIVKNGRIRTVDEHIVDIATKEGYLVTEEDGKRRWPLLENLPLAPRRFGGKKDAKRRGVQFLGEEINE